MVAAAATASVALDIGGGRGALVLYPSERFRGREIEISTLDGSARRTHTGVHERSAGADSMLTAIFGSLPAGEYLICDTERSVTVRDGEVTELAL